MKTKTVAVSGGFDPVHIGHIRLFEEAAKLGRLVVILNTDEWLKRKKGYAFMSFEERSLILMSIRYVDEVVACTDKDETVCKTLELLKPDIFANGGDRLATNIPEYEVCERLGIEMAFGIGGGKIQSSSTLVERHIREDTTSPGEIWKPWGYEKILICNADFVVKELFIKAGHRLSLQKHIVKEEIMLVIHGNGFFQKDLGAFAYCANSRVRAFHFPSETIHRITAGEDTTLIEVSTPELDDVIKIEDDYGRV